MQNRLKPSVLGKNRIWNHLPWAWNPPTLTQCLHSYNRNQTRRLRQWQPSDYPCGYHHVIDTHIGCSGRVALTLTLTTAEYSAPHWGSLCTRIKSHVRRITNRVSTRSCWYITNQTFCWKSEPDRSVRTPTWAIAALVTMTIIINHERLNYTLISYITKLTIWFEFMVCRHNCRMSWVEGGGGGGERVRSPLSTVLDFPFFLGSSRNAELPVARVGTGLF
jgi:hypothetical protein